MTNLTSPFKNKEATVDPFVGEVVTLGSIEQMSPGEITYAPAAAIHIDSSAMVMVDKLFAGRDTAPSPTANLKLIKHWDGGLYVDATALSRREMEIRFVPRDSTSYRGSAGTEPAHFIVAAGVLYPYIREAETKGFNPLDVRGFNEKQTAIRQQFAAYYEQAHSKPYVFAEQELQAITTPPPAPVSATPVSGLGTLGGG